MGSPGREDWQQGGDWGTEAGKAAASGPGNGLQTGQSHVRVQINWEEQLGSETGMQPRVSVQGNKASNL